MTGAGAAADDEAGTATTALVLVDDHAVVRQGLRAVLERVPGLSVVGEASSPDEALEVVAATQPDIVLLDLKLSSASDTDGIDVCARISAAHPGVSVLVLTTSLDDHAVVRAVSAGARGYVVKDVDTSELVRAVRLVASGESAFDARSATAVVRSLASRGAPSAHELTERELQVLRLLARGLSNRDIGRRLFISETTAKFHVGNIMRKLQVTRRAEAVYAASKRGLV